MWKYQVGPLVDMGYRVVRYDVRGHGRSMVPPSGYTWENYSRDLAELLDRLNVEGPAAEPLAVQSAHVVGLSMGGAIALRFALDSPGRVSSLTLVDSALPGFSYSPEFSRWITSLLDAVRQEGVGHAFDRLWLSHAIFDGVRKYPEKFTEVREMVAGFQAAEYRQEALEERAEQPRLADRLGEVSAPTLVVVGEDDLADFRLIADLLSENIPGARHATIPGVAHLPPMEDPDRFNSVLLGFLAETR
jgi:pimeloyl-ACP methyl ester carboxylesterase